MTHFFAKTPIHYCNLIIMAVWLSGQMKRIRIEIHPDLSTKYSQV